MKVHIRFHDANAVHTKVTVFLNGQNCGTLTIGTKDDFAFQQILSNGCNKELDTFVSSGFTFEREATHAK